MKKSDIQFHDRGHPAINVKWSPWWTQIERKFRGVTARNRRVGVYHVHEYGDDPDFWAWLDHNSDDDDFWAYPNGPGYRAEEIAREVGWEDATEYAKDLFGQFVKVYGSGRSGGWLVVDGLPDVDTWDAIAVGQWAKFRRGVRSIVDDLDYQLVWHLHVNVWEAEQDRIYDYYRRLAS